MAATLGLYPVRCWDCNRLFDPRFRAYQVLIREELERRHSAKENKEPARNNEELLDRAGLYGCCRNLALTQADEPIGDVLHMREDIKTNWVPPRPTGKLLMASAETKTETKVEKAPPRKPRLYNITASRAQERGVKEYHSAIRAGKPATMPEYGGRSISERIGRGAAVEEATAPDFDLIEDLAFGEEEPLEEEMTELSLQ